MWIWDDVRYALRAMRRAPGFTAAAVLSLAFGIGANTAIFSLIDTLMLRSLPVRQPQRLVELLRRFPGEPALNAFSWENYEYFRENCHSLSDLIAAGTSEMVVRRAAAEPERVRTAQVSGNYFPVLGLKPTLGRLIGPSEPAPAAVVSWVYWKSRFHLNPEVLGRQMVVENVPVTIVGVAPREFTGLQTGFREDLWLPARRGSTVQLVGRMKPEATIGQVRTEIAVLYQRSIESGLNGGRFVRVMKTEVEPAGAGLSRLRQQFGSPLVLVMAVVGLMLLIACTNVSSLLVARGAARRREMALRVSLGASRMRLARQVLTESLLLSGAGCAVGVLVAFLAARVLVRIMMSGRQPFELDAALDANVLLFLAAAGLVTGVLFGLAPALQAWSPAPALALRGSGGVGETKRRRLIGRFLVVAQVALSMVLLSTAYLFVRHLIHGYAGLGFHRDRVLLFSLDPARSGYQRSQLVGPYKELLRQLEAVPGVRSATLSGMTPLSGAGANRDATVEGYQPKPGELRYLAENWVAPRYFETLGQPLLAGRDFRFEDEGRPRVAIVNQTMARHYFGDASPIGRHVLFDGDDRPYEIVGLVGDAKYQEMREGTPRTIYMNAFQEGRVYSQFAVSTEIPSAGIVSEVRQAVRTVMKTVPVDRVTTMSEQVDASIVPERLMVTFSSLFGALGALLAAVGLYGLLAYTVARRTNEIGIRMALGATRGRVIGGVLSDALQTVWAGLVLALPLAFWSKRIAASLIPGLEANVLAPIAFGAAAMVALSVVAAYVPARRAARVDPMVALRYE
jgi:predicted permease